MSTVRGLLRDDHSIIDAIKAAFPGGSMTGAPKVRSMEILDRIEGKHIFLFQKFISLYFKIHKLQVLGQARGVYSGSLGYISVNQTFDLNIVIRSVVATEEEITIGAGGAIVIQSEPRMEYEEMQLKAQILLDLITLSQMDKDQIDQSKYRTTKK